MINTDLAALSDAATKAEAALEAKPGDGALIDAYITALGAYNGALIRLHRSGDLVLIDREGMRERVIEAVWNCSFHPDDVASGEAQRRIAEWPADYAKARKQADAAITAILGVQP